MPTRDLAFKPGGYRSRLFYPALIGACVPAFAVAYDVRSDPLFAAGLLVWSLVPVMVAWLIFRTGRRAAAWGWLIAVAAFGLYVWTLVVSASHGSTGVLSFLWIPVWSMAIVGPTGAFVGMLLSRIIQSTRRKVNNDG